MKEVVVKDSRLQQAAGEGMDAFVGVFVDAIRGAIGGELTAESMAELNADQITLLAWDMLHEEVMDGGFVQLIHNGLGEFIFKNPFAKALKLWGMRDLSKLIYEAHTLWLKHREEIEKDCSDEEFMALFEQFPEFDDLDDTFVENEEQWMDDSTPRVPSLVENMFGESVQFHQDAFLRDISNPKHPREVFVTYSSPWNYVLEAGYIILFLLGLYKGRRERFMLLAVSWFGVELLVHVILGFGLKDVYIMSAHWLFILPLAYGYLLINTSGRLQVIMRVAMSFFTVWLWLYNGSMLLNEFSGKL